MGTATFTKKGSKIALTVSVSGATPGEHGLHLHAMGSCTTTMDAMGAAVPGGGAGGHWNPETKMHGQFGSASHHLGDVGNLTVGADGKGTLTFETDRWVADGSGAANDVVGKAVIFHAGKDDLMTDPTGNAGGRVACGVIAAQK
jgi:Cu-Zn family superoxide dismutase